MGYTTQFNLHPKASPPSSWVFSHAQPSTTKCNKVRRSRTHTCASYQIISTLPCKNGLSLPRKKLASPLDHNPCHLNYWSEHPQDRVFGAIHNSLSSKFSGISICHPIYDDDVMYRTLKHAISSAMQQSHATATFMFLPSWGGPMSTNPYSKLLNAYPHFRRTLGTIPSTRLNYVRKILPVEMRG